MREPLHIFLVEDEVLLLTQLETSLEEQGHVIVGTASSSREAIEMAANLAPIDIHLEDGPTGVEVARFVAQRTGMSIAFMTANPKQIPHDFSGAIGVIEKPYTRYGFRSALDYIEGAIRHPPPQMELPRSQSLIGAPAPR